MNNNPDYLGIPDNIKSQLVKLPFKERSRFTTIIKKNIGKQARIIVRPKAPIIQITNLHEKHIVMLNTGWIQSVELVTDSNPLVDMQGKTLLKSDKAKIEKRITELKRKTKKNG
jgi:hypothetical protein